MILKGSQRGGGSDLATHLMNSFDNSQVEIAEVYGTVAGDLHGAFAEFEAVAAGTNSRTAAWMASSVRGAASCGAEIVNDAVLKSRSIVICT